MKIYGLRVDYNLRGDGEFFVYSDLPELVKRFDQGKLTEVSYTIFDRMCDAVDEALEGELDCQAWRWVR